LSGEIKHPKALQRELADYLGVTLSAVKQYNKKKRELMLIGLKVMQESNKEKHNDSNK